MDAPHTDPRGRHRLGALLWVASLVIIPVQLVVALAWPEGYSVRYNAISDLGVTVCGTFSEQGQQVREVCSPWHDVFNAGLVVSGVCIAVGAALLRGVWIGRGGSAATLLLRLAGLLVAIVGLAPWDTRADLHDLAALGQALAQWAGMAAAAVAAGPGLVRRLTAWALGVSVVGFVAFLAALEGTEIPVLGFGGSERLAFDTLSVWIAAVGLILLSRQRAQALADPSLGSGQG